MKTVKVEAFYNPQDWAHLLIFQITHAKKKEKK